MIGNTPRHSEIVGMFIAYRRNNMGTFLLNPPMSKINTEEKEEITRSYNVQVMLLILYLLYDVKEKKEENNKKAYYMFFHLFAHAAAK